MMRSSSVLLAALPGALAFFGKKAAPLPPPTRVEMLFVLLAKLGVPEATQVPMLVAVGTIVVFFLLLVAAAGGGPGGGGGLSLIKSFMGQESKRGIKVNDWIGDYNALHGAGEGQYDKDDKAGVEERNSMYAKMVNAYYELATLFYEWGWGQSFHFAQKKLNETFGESIRRHEYYLASQLEVKPDMKVLDVGCGIGGPYRNIARFTGCDITGITLNEYQVKRANELNKAGGLGAQVRSVQCDFMKMEPFQDNSFDAVYAIEATCHAPVRQGVYGEILRVLKPGAVFACYEWCLTDKYDTHNALHRKIKKAIEEGDGLPDMARPQEVVGRVVVPAADAQL
ncbi:S-adenosyl-L-methionine-dependent methyltransferase [Pavlovales sp. CCMP2436]|nr:S-adenosyl-L-methionine-dependent methyltransferase [Pavlovales sp. CCMP2436]